jgi:hypothetical protein
MLEPKEVLGRARQYLTEVMPEFAKLEPKVEEMSLGQDLLGKSRWRITFYVYSEKNGDPNSLADLVSRQRIEKVVSIAPNDGALIAVENPSAEF